MLAELGNVTVDSRFRNLSFQYDANNRQKQSANLDGNSAVVSVYDAGGQRVATQVGGSLTNVLVYDASGKLVAEYGSPVPAEGTQYLFADHEGSPRAISSSAGIVVSRHDYLSFGEELGLVGMRTSGQGYAGIDNARQKYAGMETDEATGLDHTLWRKFDSSSGRWTSPDPYSGSMSASSPQSFNRYTYVNNDPVNSVDPTGLMLSDIGVYQTANPEVVRMIERAEDQGVKNWVIRHQETPHTTDNSAHFGGPGNTSNGHEANHTESGGGGEHSNSGDIDAGVHGDPQNSSGEATLQVRGQAGAGLSPDDPLRFPGTNKQTLGPNAPKWGWGYQIEEVGTVPGNASTWTVTRTISDRIFATLKDGSTLAPKATTSREESNYIYNPVGGNKVYSIDAPGINRARVPADVLANAVTMRYVGNYTTRLTNGRQKVDFKWSVTVNVNMVTSRVTGQFRRGHARL